MFSRPAHVADRRADAGAGDPGDRAERAARRARRVRAVPAHVPRAHRCCGRSSPCRSCCRPSSSASRSGRCSSSGGPLGFLHLDGTFAAIVAALVFFNYAVVVRAVGGLWERLDPRAEQAARALGASPWRAFRTVTLPALTPAIASAASLVFLFCATAFGIVLVLGGLQFGTIETEIWIQTTQFLDLRAAAVLSVVQLVVVAGTLDRRRPGPVAPGAGARAHPAVRLRPTAAAAPARRHAARRRARAHPRRHRRDRARRPPAGPAAGQPGRAVAADRRRLGARPLRALGTTGGVRSTVTVWQATLNSLRIALDATVIALVVGGLVALVVSRRPRRAVGRRAVAGLDALFMLPLGVSAVTVGFGFLLSMHHPFGLPRRPADQPAAGADRAGGGRRAARRADGAARAARDRPAPARGGRDARRHARSRAADRRPVDRRPGPWASRSGSRSPRRWGSSARRRSSPAPTGRPCPS